jgi:hypothetical protein
MICHLDPTYKNMLFEVRQALGDSFTADEYKQALEPAKSKQKLLIERFGDAEERSKPYYLAELVAEEIKNIRATEVYNGARPDYSKAAPGD